MRCRRRQTVLYLIFEPVLADIPISNHSLQCAPGESGGCLRAQWHASSKSYLTAYGKRLRTGCWHQLPPFKGRGRDETAPMPTKKRLTDIVSAEQEQSI